MGYSYQIFIADDEGGVQPVPQAKWCRIIDGREALRQHANRELKTLSVILEVDRRLIRRIVRILTTRVVIDESGGIDMRAAKERAIASLGDYTNPESVESAIARLQRDASHFWIPSETHWISLSRLLRFPVDQLRRAAGEV